MRETKLTDSTACATCIAWQAEGYAFELSLADWLSGFFVPTYTKIVRQKQRGNNKATL